MAFSLPLFRSMVTKEYNKIENPVYPLESVLYVFEYYFYVYENTFRHEHPNIRAEQINSIIRAMPELDDNGASPIDGTELDPDTYETLINKHFQTQYRGCNYNINHFFSGSIRTNRFYEELY